MKGVQGALRMSEQKRAVIRNDDCTFSLSEPTVARTIDKTAIKSGT